MSKDGRPSNLVLTDYHKCHIVGPVLFSRFFRRMRATSRQRKPITSPVQTRTHDVVSLLQCRSLRSASYVKNCTCSKFAPKYGCHLVCESSNIFSFYCAGHADAEHDPNRCGRVGVIPGVCRLFHPQYVALIWKNAAKFWWNSPHGWIK